MFSVALTQAQETNANQENDVSSSINPGSFEKRDFRAKISTDYLQKFTSLSSRLQESEEELASLQYRMEAVKERSKSVKKKEQKELFKENIKTLKISEEQLMQEVKLLRKALRILQANKSNPDPEKLSALRDVSDLENQIKVASMTSADEKEEVILSKVEINMRDVYQDPPKKACKVLYNGMDSEIQKERKELAKEFFFGYTHPKLKSYFKEKDFLECNIQLIEIDKKRYLRLFIKIASKDAIKNYGYISANSTMKFELLTGENIYIASPQNAIGRLEPITGNTLYEVILPLDKSQYREFAKGEIDKFGIMWTSGYEEYEIFNVDVVMNQIECIEAL